MAKRCCLPNRLAKIDDLQDFQPGEEKNRNGFQEWKSITLSVIGSSTGTGEAIHDPILCFLPRVPFLRTNLISDERAINLLEERERKIESERERKREREREKVQSTVCLLLLLLAT